MDLIAWHEPQDVGELETEDELLRRFEENKAHLVFTWLAEVTVPQTEIFVVEAIAPIEEKKKVEKTIDYKGKPCKKRDIEDLLQDFRTSGKPKPPYKFRCCDTGCAVCYYDLLDKYEE